MSTTTVITYDEYCIKHEAFVNTYKDLYDEIAVFSVLPEQFINEADPIIQRFIESIDNPVKQRDQEKLKTVTGFIERFYAFTDSATAMFAEHQIMTEQTVQYLQDLMRLKKPRINLDDTYVQLLPLLEKLELSLTALQMKADYLKVELELLRPIWTSIVEDIK
jgi:hypothetical protein